MNQEQRRRQWLTVSSQPGTDPLSQAPRDPGAAQNAAVLDELRRLRELEERREKRSKFSIGRVLLMVFLLLVLVPLGFAFFGIIGGGIALLLVLIAAFSS